jgi:asparagine synthase (glutamine-hydrolysing)
MQGLAFDSFRLELHRLGNYPREQRAEYFNILSHNRRTTQNYVAFNSCHFENRLPGYDYQLFEFVYSFSLSRRPHRRLQQDVIECIDPRLARIPQARDGLLFTRCATPRVTHHIVTRLKQRANRHIRPIFREPTLLYADYENWLRHELRPWAEDLLFDGRLAERGIFSPDAVRSLFERHMSGQELHTVGKIAPIMTFEMMMRAFFD